MFPDSESTPCSPSHIPCLSVQTWMQWHSEQSSFITVAGPCRILTCFHLSSGRASGSHSGEHNPFVFNYTVTITFCLEIFNPAVKYFLMFFFFSSNKDCGAMRFLRQRYHPAGWKVIFTHIKKSCVGKLETKSNLCQHFLKCLMLFYGIITNIFHFICKYICHFPVMEVELQYDPVCRVIFCKSLICCALKMLAQKLWNYYFANISL